MPGEWEKHSATWLAWLNDKDYFLGRIENIKKTYLNIIAALTEGEIVKLLVLDQKIEDQVRKMLLAAGVDISRIIFYQTKYFDVWIRDYGPTFIKNEKEIAWIKWNYDGYNGRFPELLPDNKVFFDLKKEIPFRMFRADINLEGGAVESNGKGVILTTEECLLKNRNTGKSKEENDKFLEDFLGGQKIIWLKNGLVNDHTGGHVDEIARFISPAKILCAYEEDPSDENYERLSENYKILQASADQTGNKFEIIKLPMPHVFYEKGEEEHNGKKAPASYTNFYIGNKTVLVSVFNDPNDQKALSIIKNCFPDKKVIGLDCRDLLYGGGAIHCITQPEPAF